MTLDELQRSEYVRAAKWNSSERQLVLSEVLGLSLTEQILAAEAQVADGKAAQILDIAQRSIAGEPLAYSLGVSYFDGLKLAIHPEVYFGAALCSFCKMRIFITIRGSVILKTSPSLFATLCYRPLPWEV